MGAGRARRRVLSTGIGVIVALVSGCEPPPPPVELTVTTTADGGDAAPGDGVCEITAGQGDCSLRAAVDEANALTGDTAVQIDLPEGTYRLTVAGADDDNTGGDLDVNAARTVTLRGDGRGAVIDAAGADRAVHVLGATLELRHLAVTGATGAGVTVATGRTNLQAASLHGNRGAGLQIAAGATGVSADSTFSSNLGGGVDNAGEYVGLASTITANSGGGVKGVGVTRLLGVVVGDNASGPDCATVAVSAGHNLDSDGTCGLSHPTDRPATDPDLLGLGIGPVPAHPPRAGSPVIDEMPAGELLCTDGRDDQFGSARPVGDGCDLGAVELAPGTTFVVDDAGDQPDAAPGDGSCATASTTCTLRAAIDESNAHPGEDTVSLAVSPVLSLEGAGEDANATGDLDVFDAVVIEGEGATVDGAGLDRVLDVRVDVRIDHTTISGGQVTGDGGGLRATGGRVTLMQSTVHGNDAVGNGGGVAFDGEVLRVEASTVDGNGAMAPGASDGTEGYGGGLFVSRGEALVERSTLSGNSADSGGALVTGVPYFYDIDADATVRASTVTGNSGPAVQRVIMSGCYPRGGCFEYVGGPIHLQASALMNLPSNCATVDSAGFNVSSDDSCGTTATDRPGDNPLLGPLADNGGPTRTHLPYTNSPVLDIIAPGGDGTCAESTATDQRGIERPQGAGCDAGAVEGSAATGAVPLSLVVDSSADERDATPGDGVCATSAGSCTLRAAVDESNAYPTVDAIAIAEGIDPVLTRTGAGEDGNATGDLDIIQTVSLTGDGATIDGAGLDRVLDVTTLEPFTVSDLTVTGGSTDERGGGIEYAGPELVLDAVTLTGNHAGSGGGAFAAAVRATDSAFTGNEAVTDGGGVSAASLVATDTTFDENQAGGYGGGASAHSATLVRTAVRNNEAGSGAGVSLARNVSGTSTIDASSIAGNRTTGTAFEPDVGWGGGVLAWGHLTVTSTTISDNEAVSASLSAGGGIAHHGTLTVEGSTISGNTAAGGGGIAITDAVTTTLRNSTISGNAATAGSSGALGVPQATWPGGGAGTTTIVASTLQGNTATSPGAVMATGGPVSLQGSIVSSSAPDCSSSASITSLGHNLGSDASCGLTHSTDRADTDPRLLPLADNGGPTATHLLAGDSPALDAVPVGTVGLCDGTLPADQRGEPRPAGAACDIGAVEGSGTLAPLDLVVDSAADEPDAAPGDGACATASSACTLRAAVDEANTWPGHDHISIAPGVDPVLTRAGRDEGLNATGDLDVTDVLTVDGNGAVLDAAGLDRAIEADQGALLTLEELTITGGDTTGSSLPSGTGVWARGGLSMTAVVVHGNTEAGGWEAAVTVWGGPLSVDGSAIRDNGGSGIELGVSSTATTVRDTTISGNARFGMVQRGFQPVGPLTMVNSTVSGNVTGILWSGAADVRASTIAANDLGLTGDGFGAGTFTVQGVVLDNADDCADAGMTSLGSNVGDDADCGLTHATDGTAAPLLGPLADNGGPTQTHLPAADSPLIDAVPPGTTTLCDGTIATDQRGVARPSGPACDVGAVEV